MVCHLSRWVEARLPIIILLGQVLVLVFAAFVALGREAAPVSMFTGGHLVLILFSEKEHCVSAVFEVDYIRVVPDRFDTDDLLWIDDSLRPEHGLHLSTLRV